jgi:hypothetical protein
MRCTNAGADYNAEDIQWSCTASLPTDFKLGSTDVICEGYSSPDDDYVLKGSCGVEYRLLYTEAGEEKYGGGGGGWFGSGGGGRKNKGDGEGWTIDGIIFTVIFIGIVVWIGYAMYVAVRDAPGPVRRAPRRVGGWGGWGGGGGPDDPYDPPPPYPGKRYGGGASNESWRPGFWSGAAGGAAAGYMAGRAGNQRQPEVQERGSGWFGGGNSGPSRSSGSGSSSSSSARHQSTGFGSTSRR